MHLTNWLAASALLSGLWVTALPATALPRQESAGQQQTGDSLADAARKAREEHKTAPKPKKVYTDDDVKPATPSSGAGAATGTATEAGATQGAAPGHEQGAAGKGAGPEAKEKEDPETIWRKRFAAQREKIATAEQELSVLQREADKAQVQYFSDPQKALMEQNSRKDINERDAKIAQKKDEIASLKQQLSDLEDELRKSGGDPGWAR